MPLFSFEGKSPQIHPDAWIAPTATLVGDVVVEKDVSIWYGVVIRADLGRIVIREGANIQDNSVLHVGGGNVCEIGRNVTVGHQCLVHDCTIGDSALIGNGAIVLDGAVVGARTLVAAGATVTPGSQIPGESVALGSPAKKIVPLEGTAKLFVDHNAAVYHDLARRHAASVELVQE
ncbi:gamma carbonic anhydrase family protein [Kribbella sp. CA-253562]|uniref:gamma carbonic anhydrase family protein n=1 Tax=Kribbella sp. CA-253562 TaxID=3239942 RepID=UPI003D8A63C2